MIGDSLPKERDPGRLIWFPPIDPPTPAECWDDEPPSSAAPTAGSLGADEPESDASSEEESSENDESGVEIGATTLEHADDLPGIAFRIVPSDGTRGHSYDSEDSVRRSVAQRRRAPRGTRIRVYRTFCLWIDVTDEYVKP